jgi:hypothetical protein
MEFQQVQQFYPEKRQPFDFVLKYVLFLSCLILCSCQQKPETQIGNTIITATEISYENGVEKSREMIAEELFDENNRIIESKWYLDGEVSGHKIYKYGRSTEPVSIYSVNYVMNISDANKSTVSDSLVVNYSLISQNKNTLQLIGVTESLDTVDKTMITFNENGYIVNVRSRQLPQKNTLVFNYKYDEGNNLIFSEENGQKEYFENEYDQSKKLIHSVIKDSMSIVLRLHDFFYRADTVIERTLSPDKKLLSERYFFAGKKKNYVVRKEDLDVKRIYYNEKGKVERITVFEKK